MASDPRSTSYQTSSPIAIAGAVVFIAILMILVAVFAPDSVNVDSRLLIGIAVAMLVSAIILFMRLKQGGEKTSATMAQLAAERGWSIVQGKEMGPVRRTIPSGTLAVIYQIQGRTDDLQWTMEVTNTIQRHTTHRGNDKIVENRSDPPFGHWFTDAGKISAGGVLFIPDLKEAVHNELGGKNNLFTKALTAVSNIGTDTYEQYILASVNAQHWQIFPLADPALESAYVAYATDESALPQALTPELTAFLLEHTARIKGVSVNMASHIKVMDSIPIVMISSRGTELLWYGPLNYADINTIGWYLDIGTRIAAMPRVDAL